MATLEQIMDGARTLSLDEKRKLREVLDLEREHVNVQDSIETTRGENGSDNTRELRLMWLSLIEKSMTASTLHCPETC